MSTVLRNAGIKFLLILLVTLWTVTVETLKLFLDVFSSSSECVLFLCTFSFKQPPKIFEVENLEIAEATLRTFENDQLVYAQY